MKMETDVFNEMRKLSETLTAAAAAYYNGDEPLMTDAAYDEGFSRLQTLEMLFPDAVQPNSPTQRVGSEPLGEFKKAEHSFPMLSLDNIFTEADWEAFHARMVKALGTPDVAYTIEPKYDGLALELVYRHGKLAAAITRGNGQVGEDVTANARTINNIPLELSMKTPPEIFEVRGEVLITKTGLEAANKRRVALGKTPFANARNAAAGSLKLLDSREVAKRPLRFFAHTPGYCTHGAANTQHGALALFAELGFDISTFGEQKTFSGKEVRRQFLKSAQQRDSFPHDIDGMVVKVDDGEYSEPVGSDIPLPALGDRLEVRSRAARDAPAGRRFSGGPHWRHHPRRPPQAGHGRRGNRRQRHPAQ